MGIVSEKLIYEAVHSMPMGYPQSGAGGAHHRSTTMTGTGGDGAGIDRRKMAMYLGFCTLFGIFLLEPLCKALGIGLWSLPSYIVGFVVCWSYYKVWYPRVVEPLFIKDSDQY